jgi:DNA-binding transcriptional ArsR family regulator
MITGPIIAEIAALAGDPARASMLSALLDGRAMTASELAYAARVTPQTASAHLGKLTEAHLVTLLKMGRHHYFRLATPQVAQMLESIMAVALVTQPRYRPLSAQAETLRVARVCYDHFAGLLGVGLADFLVAQGHVELEEEGGQVTDQGSRFLAELGVDLFHATRQRRRFCRTCLDWTERRPHIAGAVGAALANRCFELGWTRRAKLNRGVLITPAGHSGFQKFFDLKLPADEGKAVA